MNVLSIAGSDPSSGAGIQNDIKTFSSLGAYGLAVVTAITSQNTRRFSKIEQVTSKMVTSQLCSVISDFKIDAIKIGMVYSSDVIKAIHQTIRNTKIPIILDPVFESTTGGELLKKESFADFKRFLVPLCDVITPNISESERLARMKIRNEKDARLAAIKIQKLGAKNVVITGGDTHGKTVTDFILEDSKFYSFSAKKIPIKNHGSGCTFSASLAVFLAKKNNLRDAVMLAKEFTTNAIKNSQRLGKGIAITRIDAKDEIKKELKYNISRFAQIKNAYKQIPEVGTNFVFSKPRPRSIADIVGVSGRIVKSFDKVIVAGSLEYGGSRHVGSALLEVAKKFPDKRAAINIRFDEDLVSKAQKVGFVVKSYSRQEEPQVTKTREGRTISWGIKDAIKDSKRTPDLVFHRGDIGKEPMIIIFGASPRDVLGKLANLI
ncbi:MAG: bifunctional hydroxymethylpyrimidine kinase/phosphomethylpyrimidine kinase [Nitrosopumilaceae archaeon]